MPAQTLLVGNGPNRVGNDAHSWDAVLQRLSEFAGQEEVWAEKTGKPFTLLFEEMAIRASASGHSELELKQAVARWMHELTPTWVHERLLGITHHHLLTTNYDYGFEGKGQGRRVDVSKESRYSLFRCREAGAKRVWHVHGEIDNPDTITLGYEQYVGHLYKARNYLTLDTKRARTGPKDYRSPVIHQQYNFEEQTNGIYSWADVFLRDDIHIVGFGCDYSEIDMWWLLGLKERLRQRDRRVAKGIDVGKTAFYHFQQPHVSSHKKAHLAALRNFGVQVVDIPVNEISAHGWEKLCAHLEAVI